MKKLLACSALVVAVAGSAVAADAPVSPQKPGKWSVKMQVEMPGMPFKMPAVNFDVCVTEEDLKDPQKSVPQDAKSSCKVSDYAVDGNKATWTVDCPKEKMKGTAEATYTDTSFTATTKMQTADDAEMTMKYSGTWKGECSKK